MNRKKEILLEYTYPQIYKRVMTACVFLCIGMIAVVIIRFGIEDCKAVCALLLILLGFVIFVRGAISKYKIIVNEEGLKAESFVGKSKNIRFDDIDELKKKPNGPLRIICKDISVNIDMSIGGYEQLCDLVQREFNARKQST